MKHDNIIVEQMSETLAHIRTMIDWGLNGSTCMTTDCKRLAEYQIRALDSNIAAHSKPILLCEKCLKQLRLKVDGERWEKKYRDWYI